MPGARPLVSVCVPTLDGARWLLPCLRSARRQSFRDFELLVVDDGSKDGTWELASSLSRREPRLRLRRNPRRQGLVGNWNRCVELARGTWVKFLFQDDVLAPECLARMLSAARREDLLVAARRRARFEPGVPASVRAMYRAHLAEHSIPRRFPGTTRVPAEAFARLMLLRPGYNCVGEPSAMLLRRSAFARLGPFNPELAMLCDWELAARVAVNAGLAYVDEPLATFRVHQDAQSAANRRGNRYRAEVLDELLIRHDLAFAPAYAPVRAAAERFRPRLDLRDVLARAAARARGQIPRYARHDARAAWRRVRARFPGLALLASGPHAPPHRLRGAALALLEEANA